MKKWFLVISVLLVAGSVHSQDVIDIVTRQIMTGSSYSGAFVASTQSTWTPYLNGKAISESYFYSIAGDEVASIEARHRKFAGRSLAWGGLLATAGGCALMWTTSEEGVQVYSGLGLASIGIGCLFGSIPFLGNSRPYPYALRLADSFNASQDVAEKNGRKTR